MCSEHSDSRESRIIHGPPVTPGVGLEKWAIVLLSAVLFLPALLLGWVLGCPGLEYRWKVLPFAWRGLFKPGGPTLGERVGWVIYPMDSVRHFEFSFARRALEGLQGWGAYLDVSSPRLFPLSLFRDFPNVRGVLVNPDASDIRETQHMATWLDLGGRCAYRGQLIQDVEGGALFDLITSISVVEHIPDDTRALRAMWRLLKPGGRLILTVPCRAVPMDEYADFNQYGLLPPDTEGRVFWQRFYSQACLEDRFFGVTGPPALVEVYGERWPGHYFRNVHQKLSSRWYPYWAEPAVMALGWKRFSAIEDLPGVGVVGLCFCKPFEEK